ncbi:hypothetical protein [Actinocorallia longicatena]|uniref:WD40 repeat protein n=1 Tax=Actinocorallia longicatena TaxID=111803 RepID=A0ABP6QJ00_9ACTN
MERRLLLPAVTGIAAAASSLVVMGAGAASATTTTCDTHPWIGQVQGRPYNLSAHSRTGDYLWHDRKGFHLRVTHKRKDKRIYSGAITASTKIVSLRRVKLEKKDKVWLSPDHKTVYFALNNHGRIDGFDFRTACATSLTVSDLKIGTTPQATGKVYLGHRRSHPATIPFTVTRRA